MGCIFRPEALSWEDIDGGRGEMTMEAIRNFISEYCYVGTPTATVIGFYSWKAKAENVVKIKKANPEETEGTPVDLNNIQP